MSSIEHRDLRRSFPEYHDAFVSTIGVEDDPTRLNPGISGLRRLLDIQRAEALKTRRLNSVEHARYFRFGQEVLGGILQLSEQHGVEPVPGRCHRGQLMSRSIPLTNSGTNPDWRFARTYVDVMTLNDIDASSLDLTQVHDPLQHETKNFTPWVWQFGLDVYKDDPRSRAQPVASKRSAPEWCRDVRMGSIPMTGTDLYQMYEMAHMLDTVQTRLPETPADQ